MIEIVKEMVEKDVLTMYTPKGEIQYNGVTYNVIRLDYIEALKDALYCHTLIEDVIKHSVKVTLVPTTAFSVDVHFNYGNIKYQVVKF